MNDPAAPRKLPSGSFWKTYLLPLGLLLSIIFGLAFMGQLRGCRRPEGGGVPKKTGPVLCHFLVVDPFGDEKGKTSRMVAEVGQKGSYDFPFENQEDQEGEMALVDGKCGCSSLYVCFPEEEAWQAWLKERKEKNLDAPFDDRAGPSWAPLLDPPPKEDKGKAAPLPEPKPVRIPPKGKGVLRANWVTQKSGWFFITPKLEFWPKTEEKRKIGWQALRIVVRVVPAVQFHPQRIHLDGIAQGETKSMKFDIWSSTQEVHPRLKFFDEKPLLEFEYKPLGKQGAEELQKRLRENKVEADVKVGWEGTVTLRDISGGGTRLWDLGPFSRQLRVEVVTGQGTSELGGNESLLVTGRLLSDINVGTDGNVDLGSFIGKDGTSKEMPIFTKPTVELRLVRHEPEAEFEVKLKLKNDGPSQKEWELRVKALPAPGNFPDSAAVYLSIDSGGTSRVIRVPLKGTRNIRTGS